MPEDREEARPGPRAIRRLGPGDARRIPWKNGRGVTEELAIWPAGASLERDDFHWRIARAAVDGPGPFSPFPGCERVLIVTSGAGLRLAHGGRAPGVRVLPLRPARFPGDWPTSATLLAGPVTDLNLLARRGLVDPEVSVLRPGPRSLHVREPAAASHCFVHVLAGRVPVRFGGAGPAGQAAGRAEALLAAGESLWIGPAPGAEGNEARAQLELGGGTDPGLVLVFRMAPPESAPVR